MPEEHWDTDTSSTKLNRVIRKYLLGFPVHLHFFFSVAVLHEHIDLWQGVERDLLRIHLRVYITAVQEVCSLLGQFLDSRFAGADTA